MKKRLMIFFMLINVLFIVGCKKDQKMEKFYTLKEAYEEKLLTKEDLQSIAVLHNNGKQVDNILNTEVANKIKEIAAYNMRNKESNSIDKAKASDFTITKYYGTYNKSVAFMIDDPYFAYPAEDLNIDENIAGVFFHYSTLDRILVFVSINLN